MRVKFKVMYPDDYHILEKRGKPYHPPQGSMVVMNNGGVFFLYDGEPFYPSIRKLSQVLPKYDIVWKE
tara:strand:+ start:400 stop:603 length:204 start_codon:yes stop_codon:yes gene_type:complete